MNVKNNYHETCVARHNKNTNYFINKYKEIRYHMTFNNGTIIIAIVVSFVTSTIYNPNTTTKTPQIVNMNKNALT